MCFSWNYYGPRVARAIPVASSGLIHRLSLLEFTLWYVVTSMQCSPQTFLPNFDNPSTRDFLVSFFLALKCCWKSIVYVNEIMYKFYTLLSLLFQVSVSRCIVLASLWCQTVTTHAGLLLSLSRNHAMKTKLDFLSSLSWILRF